MFLLGYKLYKFIGVSYGFVRVEKELLGGSRRTWPPTINLPQQPSANSPHDLRWSVIFRQGGVARIRSNSACFPASRKAQRDPYNLNLDASPSCLEQPVVL